MLYLFFFKSKENCMIINSHSINMIGIYYENLLKEILPYKIKFIFKIKEEINYENDSICLARIYDDDDSLYPNINKRCCNSSFNDMPVCKMHLKNNIYGLITEYPNVKLINLYKKKDINIESRINLTLKKKKNIYIKKKSINKQTMSIDYIDFKKEILDYKKYNLNVDSDQILKYILEKHSNIEISNNSRQKIIEKLEYYTKIIDSNNIYNSKSNNDNFENSNIKINTFTLNLNNLDTIQITDDLYNSCELYVFNNDNINYLINSHRNIVAYLKEWIDDDDEVPKEFKNADNKVLDPFKRLPIFEITIDKLAALYTNISEGNYREYEYDETLETFKKTNYILRSD